MFTVPGRHSILEREAAHFFPTSIILAKLNSKHDDDQPLVDNS